MIFKLLQNLLFKYVFNKSIYICKNFEVAQNLNNKLLMKYIILKIYKHLFLLLFSFSLIILFTSCFNKNDKNIEEKEKNIVLIFKNCPDSINFKMLDGNLKIRTEYDVFYVNDSLYQKFYSIRPSIMLPKNHTTG